MLTFYFGHGDTRYLYQNFWMSWPKPVKVSIPFEYDQLVKLKRRLTSAVVGKYGAKGAYKEVAFYEITVIIVSRIDPQKFKEME